MAKVKIKTRFDTSKEVINMLTNADQVMMGSMLVDEIKSSIAQGLSPVRGVGRFDGYKNPKIYPGNLKPKRPVNLYLTGRLINGIAYQIINKNSVFIRINNEPEYAKYLQNGTDKMVARQFLPKDGEEFTISISKKIIQIVANALDRAIKRGKK